MIKLDMIQIIKF